MPTLPDRGDTISVVIPAYNADRTLAAAIESVLAQTLAPFEIIVVNDGSSDGTAEVLAGFGGQIHVIDQPNGGLGSARRAGVAAARGRFIALMDADDICRPERLAVQLSALRAVPGATLCGSDFSAFDAHGPIAHSYSSQYFSTIAQAPHGIASLLAHRQSIDISHCFAARDRASLCCDVYAGDAYRALAFGNFLHPPTLMFPRELIAKIGSFSGENDGSACDWDFIVRAARAGPVAYVARALLAYRISPTQKSAASNAADNMIRNINTLKQFGRRDQELVQSNPGRFHTQLGVFYVSAADAVADGSRLLSLRLLARSMIAHGYVSRRSMIVLLKISMPTALLSAVRRRRPEASALGTLGA